MYDLRQVHEQRRAFIFICECTVDSMLTNTERTRKKVERAFNVIVHFVMLNLVSLCDFIISTGMTKKRISESSAVQIKMAMIHVQSW